jgi:hypothetical protein
MESLSFSRVLKNLHRMKDEPLPKGSLWDKTPRTRRKIVEMRKKHKLYFHLGVLRALAVFFFNSLLEPSLQSFHSMRNVSLLKF